MNTLDIFNELNKSNIIQLTYESQGVDTTIYVYEMDGCDAMGWCRIQYNTITETNKVAFDACHGLDTPHLYKWLSEKLSDAEHYAATTLAGATRAKFHSHLTFVMLQNCEVVKC